MSSQAEERSVNLESGGTLGAGNRDVLPAWWCTIGVLALDIQICGRWSGCCSGARRGALDRGGGLDAGPGPRSVPGKSKLVKSGGTAPRGPSECPDTVRTVGTSAERWGSWRGPGIAQGGRGHIKPDV